MSGQPNMKDYITSEITKTRDVMDALLQDTGLQETMLEVVNAATEAFKNNAKILLAGNGGSAADSQHLAAEIVCRLSFDRPALAAIALTTDTSILTAAGNDYAFEHIFSRQIEALGNEGDLFFAFSTSGNSNNIIAAIEAANAKNLITVGFTGGSGGKMKELCNYTILIPSPDTPKIQEGHITTGHIICALIEQQLFSSYRKVA